MHELFLIILCYLIIAQLNFLMAMSFGKVNCKLVLLFLTSLYNQSIQTIAICC